MLSTQHGVDVSLLHSLAIVSQGLRHVTRTLHSNQTPMLCLTWVMLSRSRNVTHLSVSVS